MLEATTNNIAEPAQLRPHLLTNVHLRALFQQWRNIPNDQTQSRRDVSKQIRQEIRRQKRATRRTQISTILEDYRGLKRSTTIKSGLKRTLITQMRGKDDTKHTSRDSIANAFADFYEQLHHSTRQSSSPEPPDDTVPPFTIHELNRG
eukprot:6859829-Pyramimonas_sp.AAC.1